MPSKPIDPGVWKLAILTDGSAAPKAYKNVKAGKQVAEFSELGDRLWQVLEEHSDVTKASAAHRKRFTADGLEKMNNNWKGFREMVARTHEDDEE